MQRIKINEDQLRSIVEKTVKSVLCENKKQAEIGGRFHHSREELDRDINKRISTAYKNAKVRFNRYVENVKNGKAELREHDLMYIYSESVKILDNCIDMLIDAIFPEYVNPDDSWEPEDWHERNEHGDFDNLY